MSESRIQFIPSRDSGNAQGALSRLTQGTVWSCASILRCWHRHRVREAQVRGSALRQESSLFWSHMAVTVSQEFRLGLPKCPVPTWWQCHEVFILSEQMKSYIKAVFKHMDVMSGRWLTAKQGNLCYGPLMLFDEIPSLWFGGKLQRGLYLTPTKALGQTEVGSE